jgi:restriction system protein
MKPMWMVRAEGGSFVEAFIEKGVVAMSFGVFSEFDKVTTKPIAIKLLHTAYPEYSKGKAGINGGQLYRFLREIKINDRVVTYNPSRRVYHVGTVTGEHVYDSNIILELPCCRTVNWEGEVSRDLLSVPSKNTLGAISTLFLLSDSAAAEIESVLKKGTSDVVQTDDEEKTEEVYLLKDMQNKSKEFIKDQVNKLEWDKMQELVAGLLRAMGYKTRISPPGADRGKDIVASPDGFGFENPRIVVEVKHRKEAMGSQDIRSFLGGRHKDDKGLYVITGGFTKDARYEADRANIPLTLMDLDELVSAVIEHYEKMDMETRVLVPLTKIYWPA